DPTGSPTSAGVPSLRTLSTDTWLLPASTTRRNLPSGLAWIAPCDPSPVPVPAPPIATGDSGAGVSEPSACRSRTSTVLVPTVFPSTYAWPTTGEAESALAVVANVVAETASAMVI